MTNVSLFVVSLSKVSGNYFEIGTQQNRPNSLQKLKDLRNSYTAFFISQHVCLEDRSYSSSIFVFPHKSHLRGVKYKIVNHLYYSGYFIW